MSNLKQPENFWAAKFKDGFINIFTIRDNERSALYALLRYLEDEITGEIPEEFKNPLEAGWDIVPVQVVYKGIAI